MKTLAQQLVRARCDKIPPGWMTGDELARKEGYSDIGSFRPVLRQARQAGLIEVRYFRVMWGQTTRLRPHYRYAKQRTAK